jgi:hypothetical protein
MRILMVVNSSWLLFLVGDGVRNEKIDILVRKSIYI